jgi:hypothetical protein
MVIYLCKYPWKYTDGSDFRVIQAVFCCKDSLLFTVLEGCDPEPDSQVMQK